MIDHTFSFETQLSHATWPGDSVFTSASPYAGSPLVATALQGLDCYPSDVSRSRPQEEQGVDGNSAQLAPHLPVAVRKQYRAKVGELLAAFRAIPSGAPVRLAKQTSNLFRVRAGSAGPGLNVADFDGVLAVDVAARTADVLGMTTYEHLVAATLPHGLMPLVVPQLKTITLGGAVTGLGIESTSFHAGLPHESVREMDILTGAGEVVTARPDNEHADLFFGFPNSYGTLGYALRLTIDLAPVAAYVELEHVRFHNAEEMAGAVAQIASTGSYAGRVVDFCDGTVFTPGQIYLTLGRWAEEAPYVSDYTGNRIYYKSIATKRRDYLTASDYIWRWDTDWFWCSGGIGAQNRWVRPLIPRRYLRSDTYFKIVNFARRHGLVRRWDELRRKPAREYVIQDIEVPVNRLAEFLDFFHSEVGILPVWLCPLRQRDPSRQWDLYVMSPDAVYVNVGFWASVELADGAVEGDVNRAIELEVERLGGRKSLYSSSYYPVEEFWSIYNGEAYASLKGRYDPDSRLLDLYAKCVVGR
jgi:FAD/FMN-containing dehydrogenase